VDATEPARLGAEDRRRILKDRLDTLQH
jgi:hypothetical protein